MGEQFSEPVSVAVLAYYVREWVEGWWVDGWMGAGELLMDEKTLLR